ncbi:MAG TPA: DegT/DnrJ/EryC1/StrS family aminotransferase [Chloroflexota bacterium]|nr:DegT/DnrJ/EryC1/StrS family aminotransferase [Chloroflexota bacterium]
MVQTEPRTSMQVPLVDLRVQYQALKDEILAAVADVFEGMQLFLGPNVRAFEEEFAAYCRAQDAIGVGSGTDALILGLRAADVGPGDEVITVSHTFFADTEAIALVGATPVFVDVEPDTWNLDPGKLEAAITPRTKAIIPVHLCGQPADMAPILEIARRHKLFVLEDACQAHGAEYRGQRVGAIGDAAVFSFYCSKNLGGFGEGGALTTNDAQLAARVRRLRDHGSDRRYEHAEIGTNARLDEVQAAILRVKLRHLDAWNAHRQANAAAYGEALAGTGLELPTVRPDRTHVYHLYVVQGPRRDALKDYLGERGIATGVHYPIPGHLQPAAKRWSRGPGSLPVTERLAGRVLSLPMYPELSREQILYVADTIRGFYAAG